MPLGMGTEVIIGYQGNTAATLAPGVPASVSSSLLGSLDRPRLLHDSSQGSVSLVERGTSSEHAHLSLVRDVLSSRAPAPHRQGNCTLELQSNCLAQQLNEHETEQKAAK